MAELKELFEKRDTSFKNMTQGIFSKIPHITEGATTFIQAHEGSNGTIEWEDISFFEEENFVMVIAVIEYLPGDVVELPNGREIIVPEEGGDYFKRVMRMGFPYKLATEGTAEEVVEFLEKSSAEGYNEEPEEPEMIQLPVSDVDDTEFDLDDLTDEQKEQLKLFALTSGGTVE